MPTDIQDLFERMSVEEKLGVAVSELKEFHLMPVCLWDEEDDSEHVLFMDRMTRWQRVRDVLQKRMGYLVERPELLKLMMNWEVDEYVRGEENEVSALVAQAVAEPVRVGQEVKGA
jgi:hypothetical protein